MFKVAIIGGESMGDYMRFKKKCIECLKNKVKETSVVIYTIGDRFVNVFAERYGITTKLFSADFQMYGKDALMMRNKEMLRDCDAVIIFNGSKKDVEIIKKMAGEKNLPMRVI